MIAQPVVARSKWQAEPEPSWSAGLDLPMGCVVHESADATSSSRSGVLASSASPDYHDLRYLLVFLLAYADGP